MTIMRRAIKEFHYCHDGIDPVLYRVGAMVPIKPEHIARFEDEGKIERDPSKPAIKPAQKRKPRK